VETLGSVTVICSDKTGTLTQNRMTVTVLDLPGRQVELDRHEEPHTGAGVPEDPHAPAGGDGGSTGRLGPDGWLVLAGGALCSDAVLAREDGGLETIGDPTEGALVVAAARAGLRKHALERLFPRVGELPFDSERKRMTTVHAVQAGEAGRLPAQVDGWLERSGAEAVYFTKGAVDSLLEVSTSVWSGGTVRPLDDSLRARIREANEDLASRGIRVLGVAVKAGTLPAGGQREWERDLAFVGMAGMLDPLRPEAERAVRTCRQAGIRPVMITGDHPLIARTIGRELGLGASDRFLTGAMLEGIGEVVVLHGKGTGALRSRVAELLKHDRRVESFRPGERTEGGAGVTVVSLAG
jgi:Ca2+-transporting ATPase